MIDFDIPEDLAALRDEIRGFVIDAIVPLRKGSPSDPPRSRRGTAHRIGGSGPQGGTADLSGATPIRRPRAVHREQAVLFEAAGWSTLGPVALNCAAPDEGNIRICCPRSRPPSRRRNSWSR